MMQLFILKLGTVLMLILANKVANKETLTTYYSKKVEFMLKLN